MKKLLIVAMSLCSVLAAAAAETPSPASEPATPVTPVVTSNRTVKVHSGCKPKRTGKRGGCFDIKHNCRTKTIEGKTQK